MQIFEHFEPVAPPLLTQPALAERLGSKVRFHTLSRGWNDILGVRHDVILAGIPTIHEPEEAQLSKPIIDKMRNFLYDFYAWDHNLRLADAGNFISSGDAENDKLNLKACIQDLLTLAQVVILIGADNSATVHVAETLAAKGKTLDICLADAVFKYSGTYFNSFELNPLFLDILLEKFPRELNLMSFIGIQNFLNPPGIWRQFEKYMFDILRLSDYRSQPEEAEPLIRPANIFCLDISALESSFVPELQNKRPNGFNGVEACRLARYAGMSGSLTCFHVHQIMPEKIINSTPVLPQTLAQIVWHCLDGLANRLVESLDFQGPDYISYAVHLNSIPDRDLMFYRNRITERWWMEVPYFSDSNMENIKLVPCSISDYHKAIRGECPERWWRAFKRLNN